MSIYFLISNILSPLKMKIINTFIFWKVWCIILKMAQKMIKRPMCSGANRQKEHWTRLLLLDWNCYRPFLPPPFFRAGGTGDARGAKYWPLHFFPLYKQTLSPGRRNIEQGCFCWIGIATGPFYLPLSSEPVEPGVPEEPSTGLSNFLPLYV